MELNTEEWKLKYQEMEEIDDPNQEDDDEDEDEGYSAMSMLMAAADILVENCFYESKAELYRSLMELEEPLPSSTEED